MPIRKLAPSFGVLATLLVGGSSGVAHAELRAYFLDVGQADATLLDAPGCTLLIDGGRHDRSDIVPHLYGLGVMGLDLLIGTHPHADHIGQFPKVLAEFPVGEVWMSGWEHLTQTFERSLDAILEAGAGYHEPRAGEVEECGPLLLEIVHPVEPLQNVHDNLALRVVHGEVRFLFTGDAELPHEREMIERGELLGANVLQLGHHGSRTSSSAAFLKSVDPEVAVYSAGADNRYGHPHPEVIHRLLARDVEIYGTPEHGTIQLVSDGHSLRVRTETGVGPLTEVAELADTESGLSPDECVDLNSASSEDLELITHIGPARAEAIIDSRPWGSVGNLTRIQGIGGGRMEDIQDQGLACVGGN